MEEPRTNGVDPAPVTQDLAETKTFLDRQPVVDWWFVSVVSNTRDRSENALEGRSNSNHEPKPPVSG